MGPLVPEIIGNELNLVVAFFIGIAFGFVLEQAGFSTSKKLVGLFYGYDFTVLRVFFTAGVTAMTGVIVMGHYGILDLSLIYVNPTFLYSAIAGGLIMGIGFVVGGFCPGTSLVAAAIGKIDGMIFIAGSFFGVLIFAFGYPWFEGLYKSANWGSPRIFEVLGMSQGAFAFLLMAVAVGTFYMVTLIENRVNKLGESQYKPLYVYHAAAAAALLLGFLTLLMPERKSEILNQASMSGYLEGYNKKYMTNDELAYRLLDEDPAIQIIDFRNKKDYQKFALPRSVNYTMENLFEKDAYNSLAVKGKQRVFVAYEEKTALRAARIAETLGFSGIFVLKGGVKEFVSDILNFRRPDKTSGRDEEAMFRFRERASAELPALIEKSKSSAGESKKSKRVIGGC